MTNSVTLTALSLAAGAACLLAPLPCAADAPASAAASTRESLPGLDAVLPALRAGGLVLYFRHGATEVKTGSADEKADLARCETQRNLSARGRAQSAAIGRAVKSLGIPIGEVISSPFCRCRDTAKIAFGAFRVDPDLHFAIGLSAPERERLSRALVRMLSEPPAPGGNRVIVAHTANLREAAGIWPKPEAVAYVFRPLGEGRYAALARIPPEAWASAARVAPR